MTIYTFKTQFDFTQFNTLFKNMGILKNDYVVLYKPGSNERIVRTTNIVAKVAMESYYKAQPLSEEEWFRIWNNQQKEGYNSVGNTTFIRVP